MSRTTVVRWRSRVVQTNIGGIYMSAVPFVKFYPSDWLSEESLRLVSFSARGLWIDLLCLMAKSERRGYLTVNGGVNGWVNPTLAQLARLVGSNEAEITPILEELKQAGTCSVEPETGIIYSRRMVRDSAAYAQSVAYGSKGGNPRLKSRVKGRVNPPVKATRQPSLGSGTLGSTVCSDGGAGGNPSVTADHIYEAYPKKVGRQDAIRAIEKAIGLVPPWKLLEKTKAYASATALWPDEDLVYVPHPSTWFNRGSYDDDPQTWRRLPKTNGHQGQLSIPSSEPDNMRYR